MCVHERKYDKGREEGNMQQEGKERVNSIYNCTWTCMCNLYVHTCMYTYWLCKANAGHVKLNLHVLILTIQLFPSFLPACQHNIVSPYQLLLDREGCR